MSDVKEAVRSRYASFARQLTVVQPERASDACCADGADCGCGGAYNAAELAELRRESPTRPS